MIEPQAELFESPFDDEDAAFYRQSQPASQFPLVDRSTLQNYATCPAMGRMLESKAVIDFGDEANVGEAVHQAIGRTILSIVETSHLSARGYLTPGEIASTLQQELAASRPDVQPDAIAGCRASVWGISQFLAAKNPTNLLRFDGGKGERSGQLAWDMPGCGVRITSELDLLYAGPSPAVLHEVDFKSGRTRYSIGTVRDSFQFQMHAALVLANYPEVEALEVTVWMTRFGQKTWPVVFTRDDLPRIDTRLANAAAEWLRWREALPAVVPTWPSAPKCNVCPAAPACPVARGTAAVAANPAAAVDRLVALAAAHKATQKALAEYAHETGQELEGTGGDCFGVVKPKTKKPTAGLYRRAAETVDETAGSDDADGEST